MKRIQIILCSFFCVFILSTSRAQESSLKLYYSFPSSQYGPHPFFRFQNPPSSLYKLSLAYQKRVNNGWKYEIEGGLSPISIEDNFKEFGFFGRFSLGKYLWMSKNGKIRFSIDLASRGHYYHTNYFRDGTANEGPSHRTLYGVDLRLFNHLEVDISKKLYLDLNASFLGASLSRSIYDSGNISSLPASRLENTEFKAIDGNNLIRIGLGYRF